MKKIIIKREKPSSFRARFKTSSQHFSTPDFSRGVIVLLAISSFSAAAHSESTFSFPEIWNFARKHSQEIKIVSHELESARISQTQSQRHWYPRLFLDGKMFTTNDPALSFMSLLGQRQIAPSDFISGPLNHPERTFFQRATLGLDFPVYEGGAPSARHRASIKMAESKTFELLSTKTALYADLASTYSAILSLEKQKSELQSLVETVQKTLRNYRLGSKTNPVGYSGLLGLQSLKNRLEGLLIENSARTLSYRQAIQIQTEELPESWKPQSIDLREFVVTAFKLKKSIEPGTVTPASVRALQLTVEATEEARDEAIARLLPKIGLFGSGDWYGGNRGSATSLTAGAYFQWELFSASHFGAVAHSEHRTAAAEARAQSLQRKSKIERSSATQIFTALEKTLILMEESIRLLDQQTQTARSLFRSGSMNTLQWVEVLARRIDLISSRTESELKLAQAGSTLFINSETEGFSP